MTRVVLVRHGESRWNTQRRIQGHSGVGLNETGRRQAEAVAGWLATSLGPAPVVASDLARARETAEPISAALGADLQIDENLRERSFGDWEGRSVEELATENSPLWQRWADGEDVATEIGGESGADLAARVVPAIHRHAEGVDAVVLVTHGGAIWHGLHALLELPPRTLGGVGNTGVSEVLLVDGHAWLQTYNVQPHLAPDAQATYRPRELRGHRVR